MIDWNLPVYCCRCESQQAAGYKHTLCGLCGSQEFTNRKGVIKLALADKWNERQLPMFEDEKFPFSKVQESYVILHYVDGALSAVTVPNYSEAVRIINGFSAAGQICILLPETSLVFLPKG